MNRESITKPQMILRFLEGAMHFFILGMLLSCASSAADMLRPKIIEYTVDTILGNGSSHMPRFLEELLAAAGGTAFLKKALWIPAAAVIAVTLLSVILSYFYQMCIAKGGETFVCRMRDQLYEHLAGLSVSWYSGHQTGDIIQRCTDDVEEVKTFLSDQLVTLVRMIITIILSLAFMLQISLKLGLTALASVPLLVAFSLWFHNRISNSFRICDENEGLLSTIAQENLTGVRVVRAFGRERREQERFALQNQKVTDAWVKLGKYFSWYIVAGDIMTGAIMAAVLAWGSLLCVRGELTVGELLAVLTYLAMLIRPVRSMGRVLSEMSKAGVSVNRLHEIMRAPVEADEEGADTPAMDGDIAFSHVSFSFPGQEELLQDITFTIPAGSTLGILGGTGSGKSTLVHLLARLYEIAPGQGSITVGGRDIRTMQARWVRKNIGFVLQEPFLFSRTLAENIAITREDLPETEIRAAARYACLEQTADSFPEGFQTFVGERGVTLSGGQKQRAAIARTLTRQTPILVFDDSLSAVDAETDTRIRANLSRLPQKATTILISHRITTLMAADRILVLEDGRISDMGSHQELIRRPGLYRTIFEIQQGKEEDHE